MSDYKRAILRSLQRYEEPCDIESIRRDAGIGNWNTALKHLLEMYISGDVEGLKTSKSWVFWINRAEPQNRAVEMDARERGGR
jgi:hypothetical protein